MTPTCTGLGTCHYWPRHDDRCDRNTEAHSAMCARHQDRDYLGWWDGHEIDQCCPACCGGEIDHD